MNEVNQARHSQLAAAVCTEQLTPDGGSLFLVVAKLPHAADEYDEGLQRTPELDSSVVTTTVWQVDSDARYHTRITSNKKSKYHTKRAARKP